MGVKDWHYSRRKQLILWRGVEHEGHTPFSLLNLGYVIGVGWGREANPEKATGRRAGSVGIDKAKNVSILCREIKGSLDGMGTTPSEDVKCIGLVVHSGGTEGKFPSKIILEILWPFFERLWTWGGLEACLSSPIPGVPTSAMAGWGTVRVVLPILLLRVFAKGICRYCWKKHRRPRVARSNDGKSTIDVVFFKIASTFP
jgi:hypothetical protein